MYKPPGEEIRGMSDVRQALSEADIAEDFEVISGACVSIANAIHDVFGGTIIAVTSRPGVEVIEHAAVEIDGTLYDGRGEVSQDQLCKEFTSVSRVEPGVTKKYLWEPVPADTRRHKGVLYEEVRDRLKEVVEE